MMNEMKISERCEDAVVGETPEIRKIYQIIHMAARTSHPVLIVGEPGTGKEVIARAIHSASAHRRMPFRVRNCATLRAIDLEREIVGPGEIFDGRASVGRGTLFLDQIVDLSLELQGTLLRAIQGIESNSKGDEDCPQQQTRIIAASTRDLQLAVSEGVFRRDLFFRLNALSLRVPPLRERRRDIPLLASSLLNKLSQASGTQYRLNDGALQALLTYDWPGNVRELQACLERACGAAFGPIITVLDLPSEVSGQSGATDARFPNVRVVPLSELERRSIEETLKLVAGNKQVAAELLGIGKSTLYRKLREYESEGHNR
jgi:two-component system response regulator HydG